MSARVPAGEFTVTHDCGFSKTSRTEGLAAKALRDHSCERTRIVLERAARVEARKTSEGIKRDCTCPVAKHVHGTRQAYVIDKCRCRPCREAINAVRRQESKDKAYGRHDIGRVDAAPIRERCFWLSDNGISLKRLAKLTGISTGTISKLMYGMPSRNIAPRARVEKATAERILAVQPDLSNMAGGRHVDSTGTVRRLQALVAIGWSQARLAKRIGIERSNFLILMSGTRCTVHTVRKVRDLYDELWNQPQAGTDWHSKTAATRSRNIATARGWLPPMAWDDDIIDLPEITPDLGGREKLRDTIGDDVEYMAKTGATREEIAERLGAASWEAVERQLHRINRGDLVSLVKNDTRDNARHASKGQAA